MKLISTLIFLLCVTFAFAECYDNHFDECRIERQNGKYGIVIDKQLAIPYEYDEIVPQHNCFFKVRKGRKYGIISYFYEEHKRDGRFPKEIDRPIALKKGYAWLYLSLACEYDKIGIQYPFRRLSYLWRTDCRRDHAVFSFGLLSGIIFVYISYNYPRKGTAFKYFNNTRNIVLWGAFNE